MLETSARKSKRSVRGFTLAEVLVTVAIIAVIAAVVVPAVTGQMDKGDLGRVSNDIANLRTGVEQFVSDVRKYPGTIGQLSRAITTTDKDILSSSYTSGYTSRWKGPYISKDYSTAVKTGFSWSYDTLLVKDTLAVNGTTVAYAVSLRSAVADSFSVWHLDSLIDDGDLHNGIIRYDKIVSKLKVLLVPIQ
jgi:type IV pilus assembly protein PilE